MDAGTRATFTFSGSSVSWIGYRDEWSGIANVYLDGQFKGTVDTFASPSRFQAVLFSQSGLTDSSHTLIIEATGTTNSGGAWIWIDAFQIGAGTVGTTTSVPVAAASTRIEQNIPAVGYSGKWYQNGMPALSGGGAVLSMDAGSRASLAFTGTGVSWIGYRDAWSGIANISLDNANVVRVDTYSASAVAQAKVYSISGLAPGNHTITIKVTGQKGRSSRGSWIWLDAFDILP
jgi:hypothetical protein